MQLQFAHPLLLLIAVPVLAHVLLMARRLQMLSPARRRVAVGLRVALILLFVGALAGARVARHSKELTVFFLVDGSDSLPAEQREHALAYVREKLNDMKADDRSGVIVFGANASVEHSPARAGAIEIDQFQSVIDRSNTNMADALQLARACFVGGAQRRVVLLSDGNQNAGDVAAAARTAAASDITVDVVPLRYVNRNDIIVEKAIVEHRVSLEEPFDLKIIATSRQATEGKLSIHQDGDLIVHEVVQLEAGKKNVFVVPTEVREAGFHTFEVQLDVEDDLIPENNRAYGFTYGEGEPRVLLVDGDLDPSAMLPAMLQSEKINVEVVPPEGLPFSLRDLQSYDSIIFNNVHASEFTRDQLLMIERAVHDLGIGFMMIGGENSFGAGGYNDSPIERVLPVEMEIKNEKIMPQGALVPIVHTVEIPQGQYWAEQVVDAALDVLSPRDLMGVMYYSWRDGERWLFPLQPVGSKSRMRGLLANVDWGDMPSFDRTLQMAYEALVDSGASVKHIVVISDGDPQTPNPTLAKKIRAAKISISTVCINPHSPRDTVVMRELARLGGGNYYNPTSYNNLPQIFIKEAATVRKSLLIEEPFAPVSKQYSAALIGLGEVYPQLLGYVATSPKSLADIPLETHKGDPLYAHWRHGLGKTLAFTSDAKERWAQAWTTWAEYAKFWAQTVRWSLRAPFNQNYQIRMDVEGSQGRITVDAVDNQGEFRNFLNIAGSVIAPSLEKEPVELRQTGPGRYEGTFDADEAGAYMLGATSIGVGGDGTDEGELLTGGATLSYSPEFQNSRSNEALLYELADITGGDVLEADSPVFTHDRTSFSDPRPLWPVLLTAALFVLLMDVFMRRVIIGWGDIAEGLTFAGNWLAARLRVRRTATVGPTDQLLEVKEQVRSRGAPVEADREAFLASLREVKIDRSPLAAAEPRKVTQPALAKGTATASAKKETRKQDTYTGQLLAARKRARGRLEKPEQGEGKDE